MNQTEVEQYALATLPSLYQYLKLPSISAQNQGITETADWLVNQFSKLGATQVEKWHDQGGNPIVFAEFEGQVDKTVLFYNHYDVQPPEPIAEWQTAPFEPTVRDGKLFARGICDDKGELMSRLTLIKYFQEHGGLPVNLKFFVEGEEEIGSPHVDQSVIAHATDLAADVCIWEGGGKDEEENFQVTCGLKGIVSFDLHVQTAAVDLHSSLASYADNAAWRLVQALASLRGADNRVRVAGFYDTIESLGETGQKAVARLTFNDAEVKRNYGLRRPFVYADPKSELINGTTMSINGLSAGYEGNGVKTIIPKEAHAKLDCRLIPDQEPEDIVKLIRNQLDRNGFEDVNVEFLLGERAFRTDLDSPFVQLNMTIAQEVYGEAHTKLVPNMAGGGPAKQFVDSLNVPIVMVGTHYAGSHPHSPNENIRLADYAKGTYFLGLLLTRYAR
ncbi:M20/M25/M40 family metallo-hydrolase [Secundilactobacillus kimchicus]|uniref:M20/M25/M40 family metallo-hydrolase n=1 Tax=Secundilactobacillus kimchicus TaxID=528209 RepID=UPI0024A7CC9A|nr:M20/M25/M40 family metallo-hydrolase [Secundilactobacillus kimchicus]